MSDLFTPVQFGRVELPNRIVMAPMTRSRAGLGDAPTAMNAEYYRQRASAGLIVTEGTQPSANGKGYCRTPGMHTAAQLAGWRNVVDGVKNEGGHIALQLMHCGRIAHPDNKDSGAETVAPSAIAAKGDMYTEDGMQPFATPRALRLDEIPAVIEGYRQATEYAFDAGFDAVELHCTSGYLPVQFLSTGTNQRSDAYGGSLDNRLRFVLETLEAMASVDGAGRVGIRICPGNPFNDLSDDNPEETFTALLRRIDPMGLAYLHVIRMPEGGVDNLALTRRWFSGPRIVNGSYGFDEATRTIMEGDGDLVSFARPFIANPDLVRRFREGAPLNRMNKKSLYVPGPTGYIDYPTLDQETVSTSDSPLTGNG